jgi:hypothetical protein
VRQRDVEVIVRSRLLSEYGINRPAAIDVNLEAILFQEAMRSAASFASTTAV